MQTGELKTALRIVWIVISSVMLATLVGPWILTPGQIAAAVPPCERKARYGKECFLCGMTTAFIDISRGRLRAAQRSNHGSVPLYAGFLLNEAAVVLFWKQKPCSA